MKKLCLIVEKTDTGLLGRITYGNNLIVEEAPSISRLEANLKKLLFRYHGLEPNVISFEHKYDLSALFDRFAYLKISNVAAIAEVNASLLRQYVTGQKQASANQAKKIEKALHQIGKELSTVKVYGK